MKANRHIETFQAEWNSIAIEITWESSWLSLGECLGHDMGHLEIREPLLLNRRLCRLPKRAIGRTFLHRTPLPLLEDLSPLCSRGSTKRATHRPGRKLNRPHGSSRFSDALARTSEVGEPRGARPTLTASGCGRCSSASAISLLMLSSEAFSASGSSAQRSGASAKCQPPHSRTSIAVPWWISSTLKIGWGKSKYLVMGFLLRLPDRDHRGLS